MKVWGWQWLTHVFFCLQRWWWTLSHLGSTWWCIWSSEAMVDKCHLWEMRDTGCINARNCGQPHWFSGMAEAMSWWMYSIMMLWMLSKDRCDIWVPLAMQRVVLSTCKARIADSSTYLDILYLVAQAQKKQWRVSCWAAACSLIIRCAEGSCS